MLATGQQVVMGSPKWPVCTVAKTVVGVFVFSFVHYAQLLLAFSRAACAAFFCKVNK